MAVVTFITVFAATR